MEVSRYMTDLMKLLQRFYYDFERNTVILFLDLLLTFVDDMFDGNTAVLVDCHNFCLSLVEQKLECCQIF